MVPNGSVWCRSVPLGSARFRSVPLGSVRSRYSPRRGKRGRTRMRRIQRICANNVMKGFAAFGAFARIRVLRARQARQAGRRRKKREICRLPAGRQVRNRQVLLAQWVVDLRSSANLCESLRFFAFLCKALRFVAARCSSPQTSLPGGRSLRFVANLSTCLPPGRSLSRRNRDCVWSSGSDGGPGAMGISFGDVGLVSRGGRRARRGRGGLLGGGETIAGSSLTGLDRAFCRL